MQDWIGCVCVCSHPANHTAIVTGKSCIVVDDFLFDHPAETQETEREKKSEHRSYFPTSLCVNCNKESSALQIPRVSGNKLEYVNETMPLDEREDGLDQKRIH